MRLAAILGSHKVELGLSLSRSATLLGGASHESVHFPVTAAHFVGVEVNLWQV